MWTIIFNKETKQIVGHASFETTMENLGSYEPSIVACQYIEDPTYPVGLNYRVILDAEGKIIGTEEVPVLPTPDYTRACQLLETSPLVISQPEVWELLRIYGRRLGYEFAKRMV